MENLIWLIVAVVAVIIFWLIAVYNGLITLKNRTSEAWSDIDVQLKRRYDLIPNLIETVKGYAQHEQGTLQKVVEARNAAMNQSGSAQKKAAAENIRMASRRSGQQTKKILRTCRNGRFDRAVTPRSFPKAIEYSYRSFQ